MTVVLEDDVGLFELPFTLDEDQVVPIHQDVRHGWVAQQRFERAEAEEFVQHVRDERLALEEAERSGRELRLDDDGDDTPNLRLRVLALHPGEPFEIEAVQQLLMDLRLQALILSCLGNSRTRRYRPCGGRCR